MNAELEVIATSLLAASYPEDVFGTLDGTADQKLIALKRKYHALAKKTHPEAYIGDPDAYKRAEEIFGKLSEFRDIAEERIKDGTYGTRRANAAKAKLAIVPVETKKRLYLVGRELASGDICSLYHCTYEEKGAHHEAVFKIARDSRDNDLVDNEAKMLARLHSDGDKTKEFKKYIPRLIESFSARDGGRARHVNVISFLPGFFSLEEVRRQYPSGINAADMAWMFRRLLTVLGFTHRSGIVHGAVIPPHVMINPANHGAVLIDWSCAVSLKGYGRITAISQPYEKFYPGEVFGKKDPSTATDIYMAAQCMVFLLGGDIEKGVLPNSVPKAIRNLLRSCLLKSAHARPNDAWNVYDEFSKILKSIYGSPKFRTFTMVET